ncbi:hypothetical protein RRG08_026855 [Elysia crispata]|uniref:Uncharacterized protein n=1 Tax=Elysia crispata TaxID=231223 RepID=A0AAE0Y5X2_9GAST|nr:hypothetical protein RRG08_026855 [Elysia crispata]
MDFSTESQQRHQVTQLAEVSEQKVIQSELSQLKDNSKVYYKQPNSNVFFLSSVEKEMNRSKKTIDDLMKDYQQIQEDSSK